MFCTLFFCSHSHTVVLLPTVGITCFDVSIYRCAAQFRRHKLFNINVLIKGRDGEKAIIKSFHFQYSFSNPFKLLCFPHTLHQLRRLPVVNELQRNVFYAGIFSVLSVVMSGSDPRLRTQSERRFVPSQFIIYCIWNTVIFFKLFVNNWQ